MDGGSDSVIRFGVLVRAQLVNNIPRTLCIPLVIVFRAKPSRKIFRDSSFGVYRDETDDSLKIGRSKFKYNDTHVFVDGKKYKATPGLWHLLTKSRPDKTMVTVQDRQAYKQILLQSNAHRVNYSPTGRIRANRGLKYTQFISRLFTERLVPWESLE